MSSTSSHSLLSLPLSPSLPVLYALKSHTLPLDNLPQDNSQFRRLFPDVGRIFAEKKCCHLVSA